VGGEKVCSDEGKSQSILRGGKTILLKNTVKRARVSIKNLFADKRKGESEEWNQRRANAERRKRRGGMSLIFVGGPINVVVSEKGNIPQKTVSLAVGLEKSSLKRRKRDIAFRERQPGRGGKKTVGGIAAH